MSGFEPWWSARSARERTMLAGLAGIALLLIGWMLVVRPLLDWRSAAEARHGDAVQAASEAEMLAGRLGAGGGAVPDAEMVRGLATAAGFAAEVREANGGVSVKIAAARSDLLFGWIESLENRHGLRVIAADIARNTDATLSADLVLGGAA